MAAFAERCCFFCRKTASINTRKANSKNSVDYVIITSVEQTENMDIRSLTDLPVQTFEADDCDRIESGSLG